MPRPDPNARLRRARPRSCRATQAVAGVVVLAGLLSLAGCGDDAPATTEGVDTDATTSASDGSGASDDADSGGSVGDTELPPPECDADEVACGQVCADLDTDPSNCGQCGRSCVIPQATAACVGGECVLEACSPGFSECDDDISTGCETPIDCQEGMTCQTACGSEGTVDCSDVCASAGEPVCLVPTEVCNVIDDDCDGVCDQGPLPGCRVGVHRSFSPTLGHQYTSDLAQAQSGDYSLEFENYFYLYAPGVEGLQPLFRCIKPNGKMFLTSATDCEIGVAPELTVGFISMDDRCGATPLYRTLNAGSDAHFYTTSAGERDNAVNNLGFLDQGIAGYIWGGP